MLKIPQLIQADMISHAREGYPLEVCGILGGNENTVSKIYRMTNIDASNEHFSMSPKEQFTVVKDLRANGLVMLANYHSHPESPARPSAEDIKLAATPDISYVIVSLAGEEAVVKSFKIDNGAVKGEEIEILTP